MKYIKKSSVYLIAATMILSAVSSISFAENVFIEDADNIKTTNNQEVVNLDKTPVMEEYIAKSRRKIKNNWYPPTASFENTATILVSLDKSGKLINCAILVSSGDEGFDNSLIKAVEKTKFSPLPDEIKDDSVNIDYTFNMQKRHINSKLGKGE